MAVNDRADFAIDLIPYGPTRAPANQHVVVRLAYLPPSVVGVQLFFGALSVTTYGLPL